MSINKLIKRIAIALDNDKIPYMIIGGQAVLASGIVRNTLDIDITLGVDSDSLDKLLDLCGKIGLQFKDENVREYVSQKNYFRAKDPETNIRVDFIFSFTPYERQAMKRNRKINIEGYLVGFASIEDLIIHKAFAGRAIDLEDVKNVLVKNPKLDFVYIRKWLKEFNEIPECKGLLERFETILKDTKE